MINAATNSEDTNMLACKNADTLFPTPNKHARASSNEWLDEAKMFSHGPLTMDKPHPPRERLTDYMGRLN